MIVIPLIVIRTSGNVQLYISKRVISRAVRYESFPMSYVMGIYVTI